MKQETQVNKAELVELVAARTGLTRKKSAEVLDVALQEVVAALQRDESVTLMGFGTFDVALRAGRVGSHPQKKTPILIESAKIPRFKAGKAFKDALK